LAWFSSPSHLAVVGGRYHAFSSQQAIWPVCTQPCAVILEKRVDESIQSGNFTQAKTLSSELDSLVSYYSSTVPVWPFNKDIIVKFLSPQIVPVLGIVFKLETATQGNLTAFFNYLFPAK
jgi:hypothetical protein